MYRSWPRSGRGHSRGAWPRGRGVATRNRPTAQAPPAMGDAIRTLAIHQLDIEECTANEAKISDVEYVSSYNIMGNQTGAILVPGLPPVWTPRQAIKFTAEDSGHYFRDDNAARFPQYPMEPTVRAVLAHSATIEKSSVDIFACASTLGSLLRWVSGSDRPFSMVINMVGNTAFFLRREESPKMVLEGMYGFGQQFLETCTTWDVKTKGSASHQRIIRYHFGGKLLMVRFESDGHVVDRHATAFALGTIPTGPASDKEESVEAALSALTTTNVTPISSGEGQIEIRTVGSNVQQSSLIDIKTRSVTKERDDVVAEEMPRLWIRQISKLVLAFHRRGHFENIHVDDIEEEMRQWEANSSTNLRKFSVLLSKVVATAEAASNGKIEVRQGGSGVLELRDLSSLAEEEWAALPYDLQSEWEDE